MVSQTNAMLNKNTQIPIGILSPKEYIMLSPLFIFVHYSFIDCSNSIIHVDNNKLSNHQAINLPK